MDHRFLKTNEGQIEIVPERDEVIESLKGTKSVAGGSAPGEEQKWRGPGRGIVPERDEVSSRGSAPGEEQY
jgi:hypothetical protein